MVNLFTLAQNESLAGSVYYLNSIFGTVGGVLSGTGPAILGTMFKVFNTSILAVGALIVTYTTMVSIIMTAHEGEALGKKFHTLWIPLRTVMGIAALVPTATGYSYLQIGLMWFVIQGVGAADTLWETTLRYIAAGQSTVPNAPGSSASATLQLQFGQLFQGLVCQAAAKASYGSGYYCSDHPGHTFCSSPDMLSINPGASSVYSMGPDGTCGSLTLGDASPVGQAKNQAFQQIVPTLGTLAAQLVALDYAYTNFVTTAVGTTVTPPDWVTQFCSTQPSLAGAKCTGANLAAAYPVPSGDNPQTGKATVTGLYWPYGLSATAGGNFIVTSATLYTGLVGTAMSSGAGGMSSSGGGNGSNRSLADVLNTAINNGWIFAGGYFYYIAKANNAITTNVGSIGVTPPAITDLPESTERAMTYAAKHLLDTLGTVSANSNNMGVSTSCGHSQYAGGVDSICSDLVGSWVSTMSGSSGGNMTQNPVIAAQSQGNTILLAIEIAVPLFITVAFIVGVLGGVYLGTGPLVGLPGALISVIVPVAIFVITVFLGIGITLAVYTPMIPYMLFTFGAINWLIGTIETMIAGPLVAIGLLHPEGHEIWGKAEQAMMLVLNIFLRPSLMLFGLIGGMLMSFTVVSMINYAFLNVVSMMPSGGNIIEMIFFMVLYTSLFTTAIGKCFDLIHIVPDKILRWIGGGGEQFGESGGLDKIGQSMEGATQKAAGMAEKGMSGAMDEGKKYGESTKKGKGNAAMEQAQKEKAVKGAHAALRGGAGG
jgi:conjugal transfer/type IV secretion protein DotA/TraY